MFICASSTIAFFNPGANLEKHFKGICNRFPKSQLGVAVDSPSLVFSTRSRLCQRLDTRGIDASRAFNLPNKSTTKASLFRVCKIFVSISFVVDGAGVQYEWYDEVVTGLLLCPCAQLNATSTPHGPFAGGII
jgi:hypothetical protein